MDNTGQGIAVKETMTIRVKGPDGAIKSEETITVEKSRDGKITQTRAVSGGGEEVAQ